MSARSRILIVEDDPIVALDMKESLIGFGYQVAAIAHSGRQAIEIARGERPDLALMDVRMPGTIDGIDAGRHLVYRLGIPVVYVTAHDDDTTLGRAVAGGSYGFVVKPFAPGELRAAVEVGLHRQRMEARLRESERRFAATLRSIGESVLATDPEGRVTLMNPAAEATTGWSSGEALGRSADEVVRFRDAESGEPIAAPLTEAIRSRKSLELPPGTTLEVRDGRTLPVADSISAILDDDRKVLGAVMVFRDETERLRAEQELMRTREQLLHSQKMDALGRLAGGVAHDFNNLLTAMMGYLEMALAGELEQGLRADLEEVRRCAERAANLAGQLLTVSRKEITRLEVTDADATIQEMVRMLERTVGENVRLTLELTSGVQVRVDPNRLQQVLLNLSVNAVQAMPDGGSLTIRSSVVPPASIPALADAFGSDAGHVYALSVSDDGVGMSEETRSHLFEPFFTTKEGGTGLGLATSYGIVAGAGGIIVVDSEPGEGTTMSVYLPVVNETGAGPSSD